MENETQIHFEGIIKIELSLELSPEDKVLRDEIAEALEFLGKGNYILLGLPYIPEDKFIAKFEWEAK